MPDRPRRTDARRNRNRLLSAARTVFAAEGLEAPLDHVAEAAGVSRATQHRHFPTREDLLRAIFDDNMEELAEAAAASVEPGDAYVSALFTAVEIHLRNSAFLDVFFRPTISEEIRQDIGERFLAVFAAPLEAAQAAGTVRGDLALDDTLLMLNMFAGLIAAGPYDLETRLARARSLVLDAITEPATRRPIGR